MLSWLLDARYLTCKNEFKEIHFYSFFLFFGRRQNPHTWRFLFVGRVVSLLTYLYLAVLICHVDKETLKITKLNLACFQPWCLLWYIPFSGHAGTIWIYWKEKTLSTSINNNFIFHSEDLFPYFGSLSKWERLDG